MQSAMCIFAGTPDDELLAHLDSSGPQRAADPEVAVTAPIERNSMPSFIGASAHHQRPRTASDGAMSLPGVIRISRVTPEGS